MFGPLRWRQAELTQTPRLGLLCLSGEAGYVPTDREARASLGLASTPAADSHVMPARFSTLPAAAPVAGRKRLPDWMRCPRWFTKDSWRDELRHRRAGDIAALVREVAANGGEALRLSVFWGGEAYYQSSVAPHAPGLGELDYLREARDEADRTGVKVVAYINPNALCLGHPLFDQCVIRDARNAPSRQPAYGADWRPRAAYACINHPNYRRFLRALLTEILTRYQVDGLYVDGLTPHACFCPHCRARWGELFGMAMPLDKLARITTGWAVWAEFGRDPQPVGDVENDADARRWTELMQRTLVEATHEFSRTVKQAKPAAVTLFHSHPKPGSDDAYDGTLTEVYSPQPWVHTAWRSGELASYSAGYHVPVLFNIYPHRHFTAAEARYHAVQGLAQGAYSALMRSGLPVVTLHRPHFEEDLAGFEVLVLANVALMSEAQVEAVRRFVRDGGGLIATHETSLCTEKGERRTNFALADVLGVRYEGTLGAAPRRVAWHRSHPLAAGLPSDALLEHDEPLIAVAAAGADVAGSFPEGQPALLAFEYGRGRVVYLPGRFDSMQCYTLLPAVERLFAGAVRWVARGRLPIEIEAPGPVGLSLFRQPRRLVVHLVNHQRDSRLASDAFTPMSAVSLQVVLPGDARPERVRRLWDPRELSYRVAGRTLQVVVGAIEEYEAVAVEW